MHCKLTEPEMLRPGDMFLFKFKWGFLLNHSESHCSLDDIVTVKIYNQSCLDSNLYAFVIYPLSRAVIRCIASMVNQENDQCTR